VTDFPDIRFKCTIQSAASGNILLIPREGGYLFRLYVDMGEIAPDAWLTADEVLDQARRVLAPYTLEVQEIAWFSVYRVGHTVTDKFDDVDDEDVGKRSPRDELMLEGNGTGEVRAWVAVAGAMHGHPGTTLAYEPVYEWINGMGVVIVCRRSPIHGPRSSGHTRTAESEIWAASIKFD